MPEPILPPNPELATAAIRLREWSLADADIVCAAVQDPEIPRYMGIPHNQTIEGTTRWLNFVPEDFASGAGAAFAVVAADSGSLLGSVSVTRSCDDPAIGEIGYWMAAEARNQSVATEAVRLLIPWAWEALRLERLEITTHTDNTPSMRVAEKCGFTREGTLRSYREHHGKRVDLVMWSLIKATD